MALHHVFESPFDSILWDVGHQAYVHKILTGRLDRLPKARSKDGISGFPRRDESEHDPFGTGHASTAGELGGSRCISSVPGCLVLAQPC